MDPFTFLFGAGVGTGVAFGTRYLLSHLPKRDLGVADVLPWALLIDEGVIILKDATFMAGFRLRGNDLSSAPSQAINKSAKMINQMITQMPPGYSIEFNVHRYEQREYHSRLVRQFPTEVLRNVDVERERHFTMPGSYYETEHTFIINFTPPRESTRKLEGMFVKGGQSSQNYGALLDGFKQQLDEIHGYLKPSFAISRMNDTEIVTECHKCLTGDHLPVIPDGGYLCYALANGDFSPSFVPSWNDVHIHAVTINSFGPSLRVASGDFFNGIPDDVRWHLRFIPLPRPTSEAKLRAIQRNWFSKRKGIAQFMPGAGDGNSATLENPYAVAMQEDAADALGDLTSGECTFGYVSNVCIIRDQDLERGRTRAQNVLQRAREQGFGGLVETLNAPSAFMGSLPGMGSHNLRRFMVSSRVVSHLFPVSSTWAGDLHCPSKLFPKKSPPLMVVSGSGTTPFRFHLHHGDVGHCLVVGATGAGKSVLVGTLMMSWLRYKNSRVVCFDVGRTHARLTEKADGEHVNLGGDATHPLQPLRYIDTDTDRLWAESWISAICTIANIEITPTERNEIAHAITLVVAQKPEHRTLTRLMVSLPVRIQEVIKSYTVDGAFGSIFDGVQEEDVITSRMRTVELSSILDLGEAVTVPLLMLLFRQVERSLDGHPTLIVIEEAWAALMRGEFSQRLQQWLLTLRKQNGAVIIVAHNPMQIKSLPNANIITDSCPTRILLPNPEAEVEDHAEVYRFLDLSNREITRIANAQQKRDYYYKSPRGSRLFNLQLGAKAGDVLFPPKPMTSLEQEVSRKMATNGTHIDLDLLPT